MSAESLGPKELTWFGEPERRLEEGIRRSEEGVEWCEMRDMITLPPRLP
jgi:hypothetical protein